MKDVTIKTIGWTLFGCVFAIMFYGSLMSLALSDTQLVIKIEMDNETLEAIETLKGNLTYNRIVESYWNNSRVSVETEDMKFNIN